MAAEQLMQAILERRPLMKILLTPAHDHAEAARLCSWFTSAAFIQKPYTTQQLAEAMEALLGAKDCESAKPGRPTVDRSWTEP